MNNGKYHTQEYKDKISASNDKRYGPIKDHKKICIICSSEYIFNGREFTKKYEQSNYCSRSCANNRRDWWKNNATNYRTIAFNNWDHKCAICSFDKIVAIHHVDENHNNNDPKNLIPLCPNHHEMVHSKWGDEIKPIIENLVTEKWQLYK